LDVPEDRLITFAKGVLGFPNYKQYALIQPSDESVLLWLQSCEAPELAFVVCDPQVFVTDYRVHVKEDDLRQIELEDPADGQVLVICNKVDDWLTVNLQGPVLVNCRNRQARQLVLSDRRFSTRHEVLKLSGQDEQAAATAKTA
jgi:flagellar assembly factor FliW